MTTSVSQTQLETSELLPSRFVVWICRVLCLTALCISGYLAWTAFTATEVYGCGGGEVFDCGHVLNTRYAKVLGVPVSAPAFGLYAGLLAVLAFFRRSTPEQLLRTGWGFLTVGSLAAGLAAVWFIGVQVIELKHLCAYCLGAHSCGLLLAGIVLWKHPLGWLTTGSLSAVSAAGVAGLISAQLLTEPPPTFTVERFEETPQILTGAESVHADEAAEFSPPSADESDLFAPPVIAPPVIEPPIIEPPVAAGNEFAPPIGAIQTQADEPAAIAEPASASAADEPVTDVPEAAPAKNDVTSTKDESESEFERPAIQVTSAAAGYLFFSPSTASLAQKLLPFFGDEAADDDETTDDTAASETADAKPAERLVSVSGNKFRLNTRHWPLLGDPDAKYVFVEMFDYTCPHCRSTHRAIDGAFDKYGSDLAVIALAVPLDGSCNDTVRSTSSSHRNACELAQLGVAVWRIDREKFREFHDWMFESSRSLATARRQAEKLVGKEALAAELELPHAKNYIAKHVDLYKRVGSGSVPKLMFPKSTMTGQVSSTSTLCRTIESELGE